MALRAPALPQSADLLAVTQSDIEPVMRRLDAEQRPVAWDTETQDWSPEERVSPVCRAKVVCFSLAGEGWSAVVDGALLPYFQRWLEDPRRMKIVAYTSFEKHVARNHGYDLRGVIVDTVLADHTLDASREGRHGVKEASEDLLGHSMRTFRQVCPDGDAWRAWHMERESFAAYSREDAVVERRLGMLLSSRLWAIDYSTGESAWQYYERFQQPFANLLHAIERRGVHVDEERLESAQRLCEAALEGALRDVCKILGRPGTKVEATLRSPQRLARLLYEEMKLPVLEHTRDLICPVCARSLGQEEDEAICPVHPHAGHDPKPSTSRTALAMLAEGDEDRAPSPLCAAILHYRAHEEQLDLVKRLRANVLDGRIHTSYRPDDVKSSRLSSRNPNLQQVSGKKKDLYGLRNAFRALPGRVRLRVDYEQLEYKLIAHVSQEPRLIEAFLRGEDFHAATARLMGVDRSTAKNANFCLNYGGGPVTLARTLRIPRSRAEPLYELHHRSLPRLHAWRREIADEVRRTGYSELLDGWRRPVPEIWSSKRAQVAYAERVAANNPIQGGAAKLVQCAMLRIAGEPPYASKEAERLRALDVHMDMQVHDEIGFDLPREAVAEAWPIIREIMEHPFSVVPKYPGLLGPIELCVPLRVDAKVGPSWGEGQPIEEWIAKAREE